MIKIGDAKEFVKKRKNLVKEITKSFYIRENANKEIKKFKSEMDALDRALINGQFE